MNSFLGYQTDFVTQGDILIIDHMEGGKIQKYILYIYQDKLLDPLIVSAPFLLEKNCSAREIEQG